MRHRINQPHRPKNQAYLRPLPNRNQSPRTQTMQRWIPTTRQRIERGEENEERLRGGGGNRDEEVGGGVGEEGDGGDEAVEGEGAGEEGGI